MSGINIDDKVSPEILSLVRWFAIMGVFIFFVFPWLSKDENRDVIAQYTDFVAPTS